MKSVAFFNNKGGVGKTTLLCNVAAYLAIYRGLKICVIDADPQCNATQYFFTEEKLSKIYDDHQSTTTIQNFIEPVSLGEGYSSTIQFERSPNFRVDVIPGDPRLALSEDLLAKDWSEAKGGSVRGIRTNLVFSELLSRLQNYDLVFFDVSPSLGALNRSILLSSDYFISPMSIDIFSLKAFENISEWIKDWSKDWENALNNVKDRSKIPNISTGKARFIGYVTQQYMAKRDSNGMRRPVVAYEKIRSRIDRVIEKHLLEGGFPPSPYEIGTVPNLFSLIPMSQSKNTPVFELTGADGVVGAHFAKVKDAKSIFAKVSEELLGRLSR